MNINYNFYLKSFQNRKGEQQIFLYCRCKGEQLVLSTGLRIEKRYFNIKLQKAKPQFAGVIEFNARLQAFKQAVENDLNRIISENIDISFFELKEKYLQSQKHKQKPLSVCIDDYMDYCKNKELSHNSLISYKKALFDFIELIGDLPLSAITSKHVIRYENSLKADNKRIATLHARLNAIKIFIAHFSNKGICKPLNFDLPQRQPNEYFALTKEQLQRIEAAQNLSDKETLARDIFLFCVYTAQRISDVLKIRHEQILNSSWIFSQKKTHKAITIPLSQKAMDILQRNNFNFSNTSPTEINRSLKQVAFKAGLIENVGLHIDGKTVYKPLYKAIASHCARRTAITMFVSKGIDEPTIRAITGHNDLKTYQSYIQAQNLINDKQALIIKVFEAG